MAAAALVLDLPDDVQQGLNARDQDVFDAQLLALQEVTGARVELVGGHVGGRVCCLGG